MTLSEFERQVFEVSAGSAICGIPLIRRLTPTVINMRIDLTTGEFIDAFYNERTGTTAYALIREGRRVFGADNTGGWHVHPFDDSDRHEPLVDAMTFAGFVAEVAAR